VNECNFVANDSGISPAETADRQEFNTLRLRRKWRPLSGFEKSCSDLDADLGTFLTSARRQFCV